MHTLGIKHIRLASLMVRDHAEITPRSHLQERVREKSLSLVFACLSYDFIGTTLDEASEDVGTIQAGACACSVRV